ncbi:metalloproteinase inhibitor 1-like [Pantherophis guttatus]|uniref:Metalloproteinase inhibitor 1 n=1 Tax=Pantherophis guttatus TaxID=94885 RepID=A0A6P9D1T3_PANGU|nr:metalloproteinase inhibitor 1-like [Pantherophis guttatus]
MDTTKSHGFFLATFLVLMFLGELTEACKCKQITLKDACCTHDFVMRTQFTGVKQDPASPSYMNINIFSIQPVQVFKGPKLVKNARVLYSPESQSHCGYLHRGRLIGEEYLISGSVVENRLQIKLCDFARRWDKVSDKQKVDLKSVVDKNCSTICAKL